MEEIEAQERLLLFLNTLRRRGLVSLVGP